MHKEYFGICLGSGISLSAIVFEATEGLSGNLHVIIAHTW